MDNADNKLRFHDPGNYWYSMGIDRSDSGKFKINRGGNIGDNNDFVIDYSSGKVGIGTNEPQVELDVNGNVRATAFLYSSDKRLKQNIQPIQGKEALNKIKQLQGVEFEWKDNSQKSLGLIAQDVEKVFPELVHTDNAGLKTLEYGNLIARLLKQ